MQQWERGGRKMEVRSEGKRKGEKKREKRGSKEAKVSKEGCD